jgi:hypothetical protein
VGRQQEALATQREAVQLRPDDPELRDQLRALERAATKANQVSRGG